MNAFWPLPPSLSSALVIHSQSSPSSSSSSSSLSQCQRGYHQHLSLSQCQYHQFTFCTGPPQLVLFPLFSEILSLLAEDSPPPRALSKLLPGLSAYTSASHQHQCQHHHWHQIRISITIRIATSSRLFQTPP